ARHTWRERRVLRLTLSDGAGHVGVGDAAPLPGFSPETLDAVRSDLETLPRSFPLVWSEAAADPRPPRGGRWPLWPGAGSPGTASACFAFECAALQLWARVRRRGIEHAVRATGLGAGSPSRGEGPASYAALVHRVEDAVAAVRSGHR